MACRFDSGHSHHKYKMTSYDPYYCNNCREKYLWTQEKLTPGYCGSACASSDASRKRQTSFEELLRRQRLQNIPQGAINEDAESIRAAKASDQAVIREQKCSCCGIESWCDQLLSFVEVHADHDTTNNRNSNLVLMCPNCASQH